MKNRYLEALKSSALSISPIVLLVVLMSFIPTPSGRLVPLDFARGDYLLLLIGLGNKVKSFVLYHKSFLFPIC